MGATTKAQGSSTENRDKKGTPPQGGRPVSGSVGRVRLSPRLALRALSVIGVVLLWQVLAANDVNLFVRFGNVPAPTEVLSAAAELASDPKFYLHIMVSVERVAIGFALAAAVGIPAGLIIGMWRIGEDLILPVVELVRPIPAVAWIPMAILMWPTQETSIIFIIFLSSVFPIVLNTAQGVEGVPRSLVRAATSLGAGRLSTIRHVVLPGALPAIFSGLTVGMGVAWFGLIAAEIIAGEYGIGYFTWEAYSLVNYENIVTGMICIGILGLLSSAIIRLSGRLVMRWQPRETKGD